MPRKPLTTAQRDLAAAYLPLARSLAKPYKARFPRLRAEFDSAAGLGVTQAARKFDAACGLRFATYARHRITFAMRDVLREALPLGFRESHRGPMTATIMHWRWLEWNAAEFLVHLQGAPAPGAAMETAEFLPALCRKLPARHAAVIRAMYIDGLDQHQTAAALGRGQSRISAIHAEALVLLRHELARPA